MRHILRCIHHIVLGRKGSFKGNIYILSYHGNDTSPRVGFLLNIDLDTHKIVAQR